MDPWPKISRGGRSEPALPLHAAPPVVPEPRPALRTAPASPQAPSRHPSSLVSVPSAATPLPTATRRSPRCARPRECRHRPPERRAPAPRRPPAPSSPQWRDHSHRPLLYRSWPRGNTGNSYTSTIFSCHSHEDTSSFSRSPPLPSFCRQISANTRDPWRRNGVRALALWAFDGSRPPPLPQYRLNSRNFNDNCVVFSPSSPPLSAPSLRRDEPQVPHSPQVPPGNGAAGADVIRSEAMRKSHRRRHPRCSPHDPAPTSTTTDFASRSYRSDSSNNSDPKLSSTCSSVVLPAPPSRRRHCSRRPLSLWPRRLIPSPLPLARPQPPSHGNPNLPTTATSAPRWPPPRSSDHRCPHSAAPTSLNSRRQQPRPPPLATFRTTTTVASTSQGPRPPSPHVTVTAGPHTHHRTSHKSLPPQTTPLPPTSAFAIIINKYLSLRGPTSRCSRRFEARDP